MASPPERVPAQSRGTGLATAGSLTAGGMMTMNLLAYAFTLLASHALGPEHFGAVSAFLGILLVANVGALALQATAARRIATTSGHDRSQTRDEVARDVVVSTLRVAAGLGTVMVLLVPVFTLALHVSWVACALMALTVGPLTMIGGYLGILQGAERWRLLALTYVCIGVGRAIFGIGGILINPTATGAMAGVLLGALLPALVGWWSCRHVSRASGSRETPVAHKSVLREVWLNGHNLLAFFVLSNLDVIIARNQFDHRTAGIYAAGSILTKTCLFLPQFVIIAAFPKMAQDHAVDHNDRSWLKPLTLVAALGLCAVLGCLAFPDLAVAFVGGGEYSELAEYAWLFTLAGTALAVLQMAVYRQISRQVQVAIYLWSAVVALAVAGVLLADGNRQLVIMVLAAIALAGIPVVLARPGGRKG